MIPVSLSKTAVSVTTGASSATLTTALDNTQPPGGAVYRLVCSAAAWYAQGIADTVFTATDFTNANLAVAGGHNLTTGDAVQVSSTTTLPGGLAAATTYFTIVTGGATVFRLATTRANAIAGTAITLTTAGTGTHTVTGAPAVASGAGSDQLVAGLPVYLDGSSGAKVAVIQDAAAGKATISQVRVSRG